MFRSDRNEDVEHRDVRWAYSWRSSNTFIISTLSLALFTDELLFAFMVPLLPTLLEQRIGLDPSLTQRYTSIFLAEGAFVTILSSPFIGSLVDAVSSKKTILLILLFLALISIACLSLTTELLWLFVGRFFQCIVSQAMWIVGMATMAENIGTEHMGKIAGLSSSLTAAGTTVGPLLAGLLFAAGGYWCAWAGAVAFLLLDIIMRLIMLEKPTESRPPGSENREREPLLNDNVNLRINNGTQSDRSPTVEVGGWQFYVCVLHEGRFSAGLFCSYAFAVLIGCFESTLAVHIRSAFGWNALEVGLLLGLIQGPGILLAAPVGFIKDRIGSQIVTAVGFFTLVPFIILLGVPGENRFHLPMAAAWEKSLYVSCMAVIGCLMCLLTGLGSIEATETVDRLTAREPGKFGPNGGYARALAMANMSWMAGLMTGPILAGFVLEWFEYFELQCCLGVIAFTAGLIALLFLGPPRPHDAEQQDV